MMRHISKSIILMVFAVAICCGLYPLTLWVIGQTLFPAQANGSLVRDAAGTVVGSRLIAQPFTKDEYFHPRPSAPSYDASASAPSNLAPSNYALRARVAGIIGPLATYRGGAKAGQPVGPDIEGWFQQDVFQGQPHLVAQWADAHNSLAQAWVKADPSHAAYVDEWAKTHPEAVAEWVKNNPDSPAPQAADLAVAFFDDFSNQFPGKFPAPVEHETSDGKSETVVEPVKDGADIQSTFFDMWRQEHPDVALEDVPADLVMASGSGLDPHITLDNARFQIERVADAWAKDTKRDPGQVRHDIEELLRQHTFAPAAGLFGVPMVNVLELNLELRKRYGEPTGSAT
jgi:potassium-transporting ATPase KdpC subunit